MSASDDPLSQAVELRARREPFVLATVVACRRPTSACRGAKAIIEAGGAFSGRVGGSCAQQLVIIGETPLAQPLARAGALIEFDVCVSDPGATGDRFPDADLVLTDLAAVPPRLSPDSYVAVATQGQYDEDALAAVLRSEAGHVGLVASAKRAESVLQYLHDSGFDSQDLERLRCPAGLSLGAVTPPEIALSIAAEILQVKRSRSAQHREAALEAAAADPSAAGSASEALDPVCGMAMAVATARHTSEHEGQTIYFCDAGCRERFVQEPQRYPAARAQNSV